MGNNSTKVNPNPHSPLLSQLLTPNPGKKQQLSILLAKFTSMIKFQKQCKLITPTSSLKLTPTILSLYWHQEYSSKIGWWYEYLKDQLKLLLGKKSMIFVTKEQWRLCLGLSQFVMLACDEVVREFLNASQSVKIVQWIQQQGKNQTAFISRPWLLDPIESCFSNPKTRQLRDTLRQFIYYSLYAKNKIIPNFSVSFTQIYRTIECLLCLYLKLEFETPSLQTTALKRNITIGAYCVGLGLEYDNQLIIELAVRFLNSIFERVKSSPQCLNQLKLKPIPSKYFKQIPELTSHNLYETIASYLLLALSTRPQDLDIHQILLTLETMFNFPAIRDKIRDKEISGLMAKVLEKGEIRKEWMARVDKIMEGFIAREVRDGEGGHKNSKEIYDFNAVDVESEEVRTQLDKHKNQKEQKQQNPNNNPNISPSMKQIHQIHHQILIRRFIPTINQQYKNTTKQLQKQQEDEIQFPKRLKQFQVISVENKSEKVSKKNSEEDSLQVVIGQEGSQKIMKPYKIQELE